MDFQEYRTWIKQFLKEGKVISPEVTQFSDKIIKLNSQALIQLIQQHVGKKEYRNLTALSELLRSDGFFYFDYTEEFGTILEMMLLQAIAVFDSGEVFNDQYVLWLPRGLYDLIFHQIRFEEYPPICFELYFELSKRLLDPHFISLFESDYDGSYSQSLYFIDMSDHVFAKKPEKFFVLWHLIEPQIKDGRGFHWVEEHWPTAYAELVNHEE